MSKRGFSIVEMMVVIGVVATLALMTLPSLLEKSIREQVVEALPLADIAKPPIMRPSVRRSISTRTT